MTTWKTIARYAGSVDIFQTVGSGLKTGRRIFYLKVEKVEEGKSKERSLKNLFDFFDFAVYKILHVSTVTIVYEYERCPGGMGRGMIGDYGEAALRRRITTRYIGRVIHFLDTVSSTNDYAKALAAGGAVEGTLVAADCQSAGRGSGNRQWLSPPQTNIYASCILTPPLQARRIRELGILAAYSLARTLRERQEVPVRLKWPNDLVLEGKKIGGLLSEGDAAGDRVSWLVIGLGLNVNTPAFPPELEGRAGSLVLACGRLFDRGALLAAYLGRLEEEYDRYKGEESLEYLIPAYDALLSHRGQPVRLIQARRETLVLSEGINRFGELRVREKNGTIRPVGMGEVSVRGPEGYI